MRDRHTVVGGTQTSRFTYTLDRRGHRTASTETLGSTTRTITYTYDGLYRLTGAAESPGTTYAYRYDLVGNRTEVQVNGTVTHSHSYNAANQVVGWTYDAAGNLTNDGTRTYSYDDYDRLASVTQDGQSTNYLYNADGTLVSELRAAGTRTYTQDWTAGLSQVLEQHDGSTTTTYLYGHERLLAQTGTVQTWYGTDALGSVRQTLDDTGTPLASLSYDPWGTPQNSATPPTFGFTGELQDAASGLVYLRARWYQPGAGSFLSRDPFDGFDTLPYSLHPYQYAYADPVLHTDPSGRCIEGWEADCDDEDSNRKPFDPEEFLDGVHLILDTVGLFPGAGEPADVVNAGLYAVRGKWSDAGVSFCAIIPFGDWFVKGWKGFRHVSSGVFDLGQVAPRLPSGPVDDLGQPIPHSSRARSGSQGGGGGSRVTLRGTPGDKLPLWKEGDKTRGVLDTGTDQIDLDSGRHEPAASMPANTPGMRKDMSVRDHVEAHAAAVMRQRGLQEATLYINKTPCPGLLGCNNMLKHMLPEGSTLHVLVKVGVQEWEVRKYQGLPDSDWKWPR